VVVTKTVYFERKYKVPIENLKSTRDIDRVIEKSIGRKLEVKKISDVIVNHAGCVFDLKKYDIDRMVENQFK
jgi:hypothetical protein